MIQTTTRKKVRIEMVFKDVNIPDTYFAPHTVIHDLVVPSGEGHNVPLAAYVNKSLVFNQPIPAWVGDHSTYSQAFLEHITKFRRYFYFTFGWKGRRVKLIPVERCPWVYKRTGKLVEITNDDVLTVIWGIICHFQTHQKDFVFAIIRPITAMPDTIPFYPYKVEYDTDFEKLSFIYPKIKQL